MLGSKRLSVNSNVYVSPRSHRLTAHLFIYKMVSAARPVLGRMAARIVNVSGARSYSSIVRVTGTRSISAAGASPLVSGASIPECSPTLSQPLVPRRYGHTVRIILKEDLPDGRGYSGDVMTVKAGYARNYLVPKKMALYATPENFERLGVTDPEAETMEEKRARLAAEAAAEEDEEAAADLRAADLLKHYLRNKVVSRFHATQVLTCPPSVALSLLFRTLPSLAHLSFSSHIVFFSFDIKSHEYWLPPYLDSSRSNAMSTPRRVPSILVWSMHRMFGRSCPSSCELIWRITRLFS